MIKWLKQYQKFIIVCSFAYLYVLLALVLPTSNQATTPGPISPVQSIITIDGYPLSDNFYTVAVISYRPITPFQSMIVELDTQSVLRPITARQKDTTLLEEFRQGQITKEVSYHMAVIQAYEQASLVKPEINITYEYQGLIVYYRPSKLKGLLEIGDLIININGIDHQNMSHAAFRLLAYQDEVTFTIKRELSNGDVSMHEVTYQYVEEDQRMLFYPKYNIINAFPQYDFPGLNSITGGPSGGLIQTLSIYVSLVNINTENLKIAGTGTIEYGGLVGNVGGIPQKFYAVKREKIDLFFMPKAQYNLIPNVTHNIDIIPVETLEEAIYELNQRLNN
jgi:Lon-like protease